MEDCFIKGDLIYLRLPDLVADVENGDWYKWFNQDSVTKYLLHGVYPNSLEKQLEHVKNSLNRDDTVIFSIIEKSNDSLVGIVSFQRIDLINRTAEIAIIMGNEKYPHGAPLEAMALMTQYGFEKLNLNKINAGQHIGLWKWVNTLELIGYTLEGYIEKTHIRFGIVSDSVRMGISSDTYFNLKKERSGKYLTEDLNSLLKKRRKENMCQKLSNLLAKLYD